MSLSLRDMWTSDATTAFELFANCFYRVHWMLAPGKDYPISCSPPDDLQRRHRYDAWVSCLGPSDSAAMIAAQRMRDEERDRE